MTPSTLGRGLPDDDGRAVGVGVDASLGAAADGVPAVGALEVGALEVGALEVGALAGVWVSGGEQPASAPMAAPADPSSIVRREIMF
jgi:hypothetical protein